MEIRAAVPADAEQIHAVARRTWHDTYDEILGEDAVSEQLAEWYAVEELRSSIDTADHSTFVAGSDDVVGFVQGGPTDDGPAEVAVYRIYVLPTHWGDGIGTRLLERLFEAFRAAGYETVSVSVMKANEIGRSFYETHEFVVRDERSVELAGQEITDLVLLRDL